MKQNGQGPAVTRAVPGKPAKPGGQNPAKRSAAPEQPAQQNGRERTAVPAAQKKPVNQHGEQIIGRYTEHPAGGKNLFLPELLSPAGSPEALRAAIEGGADAVYLGGIGFNARAGAQNFDTQSLREGIALAHAYGVKVYVTLNTQVYDRELPDWLRAVEGAYTAGADALILADIGGAALVKRCFPAFEIHASTQMSGHNTDMAAELKTLGFSRMVVARETSYENLVTLCQNTPIETELFVHGALCVSASGQCLFSYAVGGRSGNRGECAQPCRLPYGGQDTYPLSLKDLSLAEHIPELIASGVSSLKIEGRMKSPSYVYGVTTVFRRLLDECRAATPGEMRELAELFSRGGFTDGYFRGKPDGSMLGIRSREDKEVSRAAQPFGGLTRKVPLDMVLTVKRGKPVTLTVTDAGGKSATVTGEIPEEAQNRPSKKEDLLPKLTRLGGTPYEVRRAEIFLDDGLLLPFSALNAMRRDAVGALTATGRVSPGLFRGTIGDEVLSGLGKNLCAGAGNDSADKRDTTAGTRDVTAGTEDTTAGTRDVTAGADDTTAGTRDATADLKEEAAGAEDVTAGADDTTAGTRDVTADLKEEAAGAKDVTAGADDTTAGADDTTAGTRDVTAGTEDTAAHTDISPEIPRRQAVCYLPEQLTDRVRETFDRVYLPLEYFSGGAYPKSADARARAIPGSRQTPLPWVPEGVLLPPVIPDSERADVLRRLTEARHMGAEYALTGNVGHLDVVREAGLIPVGDFRLNVCNAASLAVERALGFQGVILSPELTLPRLRDLSFPDTAAIVYGRMPLMVLEKCVGTELGGCTRCAENRLALTDRTGTVFPVLRTPPHRSLVFNSVPTFMADRAELLARYRVLRQVFLFTAESPEEVNRVIAAYEKGAAPAGAARRIGMS